MKKLNQTVAARPIPNFANFNTTTNCLWANNGVSTGGGAAWFIPPIQGTGATQVVGTKYNMKYVEVLIPIVNDTTVNSGTDCDFLRVWIIKERVKNIAPSIANTFDANNFFAPINTKDWDVQFDKIYPINLGVLAGNMQCLTKGVPKLFRFIIPLKETLEVVMAEPDDKFRFRVYIFAANFFTNLKFTTPAYSFSYHFIDP